MAQYTGKSPYEIREALLSQAYSILNERRYAIRVRNENDWSVAKEIWTLKAANGEYTDCPPFPEMPEISTEDIITEARKLNEFVSNG